MARVKVGDKAPHVTLATVDGQTVQFGGRSDNGRSTHLIFLRHLA